MKNIFYFLFIALFLISCSKKESPVIVSEAPIPKIIRMDGKIVTVEATEYAFLIESPIIKDELDNVVKDNKKIILTGNNNVLLSVDNIDFSNSIETFTTNGKVNFYVKIVNSKSGLYQVQAKSFDSVSAFANYFINLIPSVPHSIDKVYTNRFEDTPPYNNIKDGNEKYSIISDGQNTGYVTLGAIKDKFGNMLSNIKIRMIVDKGEIVSENPTLSIDGTAVFNLLTDGTRGSVNTRFEVLDQNNNVIITKDDTINFVSQNIEITGASLDYGQVFLNDTKKQTYNIQNSGNMLANNISYIVRTPFNVINDESTCVEKTKLYPDESCTLTIEFTAGVRDLFESEFSIFSSPNYTPNANNTKILKAHAIAPPLLTPELSIYNFDETKCGTNHKIETYVKNNGDVVANNVSTQIFKQLATFRENGDISIEFPPKDQNMTSDFNEVVNCGDEFPPNRKCRIFINYNPTALESVNIFNGKMIYNNQESSINVRVNTLVGDPAGTIPLTLTNPDSENPNQIISSIISASSVRTRVKIGPIKDACQNVVADGTPIQITSTKGILVQNTANTDYGMANIDWRGSDNPDDIGQAQIVVQSGEALGSALLIYNGIKLKISGNENVGQILTKKTQSFIYAITNEGTITATNLFIDLDYKKSLDLNNDGINERSPWGSIDQSYDGGCRDGILLSGETCNIKMIFNTQNFGVGLIDGTIKASANEYGRNNVELSFTGNSELPPVLTLSEATHDFGTINASPFYPSKIFTLTNQGPAIAYNLNLQGQFPFVIKEHNCGTELSGTVGSNTCQITIELQSKTVGLYSGVLNVLSEFSSTNSQLSARVIPGIAGGVIPISFDKNSVPADRTSLINVVVGPLKDDYNNIIPQGTIIEISSDGGILSIDPDLNNIQNVATDANGVINFNIRSKTLDEVKNFTLTAKVYNGANIIAQGEKTGSFTGGILKFEDDFVDFGDITIGVVITKTFPIKNIGSENINNLIFNTSNSYFNVIDYGDCNGTVKQINAGQTCLITVSFFPPFEGGVSGKLSVSGSGNGVLFDSIDLNGVAVLPAKFRLVSNTININIPPNQGYNGSITLFNDGNEIVSSIQVIPEFFSNYFIFNYNNCVVINPQSSCQIGYSFNPSSIGSNGFNTKLTFMGESPSRTISIDANFNAFPHTLILNTSKSSLYADECSNVTIKLIDTDSNFIVPNTTFNVNLESNLPGTYFNGTNCTGSTILNKQFVAGQNSITNISFKPFSVGNYLLKGTHPLLLSNSSLINVEKLNLEILYDTHNNGIANINDCIPLTMNIKTNAGVLYSVQSNTLFNLSSTNNGTFWANSSCVSTQISSFTFVGGTNNQTIYFRPENIGNTVVEINNPNINFNNILFNVINFLSLEVSGNALFDCKQGNIIFPCPTSIAYNSGSNKVNLIEKDITNDIVNGTTILNLENTNNLLAGQFVIIKTKPNNAIDSVKMVKHEYAYISAIINTNTISISKYDGGPLTIAQNGVSDNVKLIVIPEINTLYLRNGSKITSSPINYSNGNGGFLGLSIKNKIIGERSSPVNSINTINGIIYGDGIIINSPDSNTVEIIGGN